MPAEALRWSLVSRRGSLSSLSSDEIQPETPSQGAFEFSTMSDGSTTRAGKHAELFHERSFRNLHLPHVQLDEIRTRLRSSSQVLWLWLAIDARTKILPVLALGPRTQTIAHRLIHSLRERLAAFLPSALYQ